jgi:uroporphyrinogen-III synthase
MAWLGEEADEHAVEVAVARLRRRLGTRGHLLETVFRRGYRLAA